MINPKRELSDLSPLERFELRCRIAELVSKQSRKISRDIVKDVRRTVIEPVKKIKK